MEDTTQYIEDGLAHLADREIYQPIPEDPTAKLTEAINEYANLIERKGHIVRHMRDYLTNNAAKVRTQQLYLLKKVHKGPNIVRPIVSGSGGPTENVSALLDYFLQPLLPNIPSYLKDSKHVVMLLEKHMFPPDCVLSTVDVKSLYLNIPHEEGIRSALDALYKSNPNRDEVPFPDITAEALLRTVLEQNYFEFNGQMFHQVRGTAMGTKMAPAYANIFMADLEHRIIEGLTNKPRLWKRFIDDILAIWTGNPDDVMNTLNQLNRTHKTIKFTHEISPDHVVFMDLEIYKGKRFRETGKLDIRPHFKPTNKFQYLHYSSSHPKATFKGIVRGELTRILRSSSDQDTYNHNKRFLIAQFRARGYPKALLQDEMNKVKFTDRWLTLQEKPTTELDRPPFITLYSSQITPRQLSEALQPPPGTPQPVLCFRKDKSISSRLVRARLRARTPTRSDSRICIRTRPYFKGHSRPCSTPGCLCCTCMSGRERIQAPTGTYATPFDTSCDSTGLVYLIECKLCTSRNCYVGQTSRTLKERMAGHRAAYNNNKNMPLYIHFRRRGHTFAQASVTVLQVLHTPSEENLLQAEANWMKALNSKIPNGLNSKF